jgi:hypothetical protein
VVRTVEQQQRDLLASLDQGTVAEQAEEFWRRVTEAALIYGPLFFELSAHAMQDQPHTEALKADLINVWLPPLTDLCIRAGIAPDQAPAYARLGLAASRGLGVDEASALLNRLFALPA